QCRPHRHSEAAGHSSCCAKTRCHPHTGHAARHGISGQKRHQHLGTSCGNRRAEKTVIKHTSRRKRIMTTPTDNQLLSQTGPGTPMGKLFRRYWLPFLLAEELPEPDCAPVKVKLLSEE